MVKDNHISEEKLVDYLQGQLSESEAQGIQRHVEDCVKCQQTLAFWQETLEMDEDLQPSAKLKEKIDQSLLVERSLKQRLIKWKMPLFGLAGVIVIVILCFSLTDILKVQQTVEPDYEVYQNQDIMSDQVFMNNPVVDSQPIKPYEDFDEMEGMVWINPQTQEILLEMEGLTNIYNNDYQIWIIDKNGNINGDLIIVENGSARVLYRVEDLSDFRIMKGSVEPPGGSHRPTGPETFYVDIEK
ncbi:anti-sigma factor [Gracilibacillus lacisalsi]|uniref:anti-sigma factor n=1 Tax=Gracilibacillus lacisalsi TaxID=393087 RepID=UPI0003647123|nr:anti-sigma factor [Gracilibacillus lacisalsi]